MRRLAARISARSRRRKLDLFLEVMRPTAETTVVDVGVSDGGYGEDTYGTANFFEALYPWPERIVAVSTQHLTVFQQAFPKVTAVRADGRGAPLPRRRVRHRLLERRRRAPARPRLATRIRRRALPGLPAGLRHDAEPAVPDRHAHARAARALASGRAPRRRLPGASGARKGSGLRLLTPDGLLGLFPASAQPRILRRGMTIVASWPDP